MNRPNKAFILAGGKGTRLQPLTHEISKPLITVRKKPILNYLVDMFSNHGVVDFLISINYDQVKEFNEWKQKHCPNKNIEFVVESKPLGTFGALKLAQDKLRADPFFMSNGDELKSVNLDKLIENHLKHGPVATMWLVPVANPEEYGVPILDGYKIKNFLEKPNNPPSDHISSGLYIMNPEVFEYFPHKNASFSMIEKDLFPRLAKENKLNGCKINGQWFDCGTFDRWEKAIKEWRG